MIQMHLSYFEDIIQVHMEHSVLVKRYLMSSGGVVTVGCKRRYQ